MGLHTVVWDTEKVGPAQEAADQVVAASYEDRDALEVFSQAVDCVTYEFENIPYETARQLGDRIGVFPPPQLLFVSQNRLREKDRARAAGLPTTPYREVSSAEQASQAAKEVGLPGIFKTVSGGYDGKGQTRVATVEQAEQAFKALFANRPLIYERQINFVGEISVVVARDQLGTVVTYPISENHHRQGILDWTLAPARVPASVAHDAAAGARVMAEDLDLVGVMAVEFFVTADHQVLFNELAPRPHNSGHWTIEAAWPSQFTQHMRAVAGWPVLAPRQFAPAVMINLMGELFMEGLDPLESLVRLDGTQLHWYGKREMRPGRKVGHATVMGDTVDQALQGAREAKRILGGEWYDGA